MSNSATPWAAACQAPQFPLSPGVGSNSCPSGWCPWDLTISSSAAPLSFCLQSFPALESFPVSQLFASGGQGIRASATVLPVNIQGWTISINVIICCMVFMLMMLGNKSFPHAFWCFVPEKAVFPPFPFPQSRSRCTQQLHFSSSSSLPPCSPCVHHTPHPVTAWSAKCGPARFTAMAPWVHVVSLVFSIPCLITTVISHVEEIPAKPSSLPLTLKIRVCRFLSELTPRTSLWWSGWDCSMFPRQ